MEPSDFLGTGPDEVIWWTLALEEAAHRGVIFDPTLVVPSGDIAVDMDRLPAEAIVRVLKTSPHLKALRITSACISGPLVLPRFEGHLSITDSHFDLPLLIAGAHLAGLDFAGSHLPALKISECTSAGPVVLAGATIEGPLVVTASRFQSALAFDQVEVKGHAQLESVLIAETASLRNARFYTGLIVRHVTAKALDMSGCKLKGNTALSLEGCRFGDDHFFAETGGRVDLSSIETSGRVNIWHTQGELLDLSNAALMPAMDGTDNSTLSLDPMAGREPVFHDDYAPHTDDDYAVYTDEDEEFALDNRYRRSEPTQFHRILTRGLLVVGNVEAATAIGFSMKVGWQNRLTRGLLQAARTTFAAWPVAVVVGLITFAVLRLSSPPSIADPVQAIGISFLIAFFSGILSCAVLENLKRLLRLRGFYQMLAFRTWLNYRVGDDAAGLRAYTEFITLTGVTVRNNFSRGANTPTRKQTSVFANLRFFDIPIEQLAAQLSDVTETALSDQEQYKFLCLAMAGMDYPLGDSNEAKMAELEARVRRSVDHMQITIGEGWRRYLVGAATGLSGLAGTLYVEIYDVPWQDSRLTVVVATFVGGFLAWLTRDLAAGVSKLRR